MFMRAALVLAAVVAASGTSHAWGQAAPAAPAAGGMSPLQWPVPTAENRLWTRWWWMGNAVDEANLTKQLEKFHEAGLGGVEICPIYGVYGAENRYLDFLSPKWMGMLSHTVRETRRLGMVTDMTTGTGWPFGGSIVADAEASKGIVFKTFDRLPDVKALPTGKLVCVMAYPPNAAPADITVPLTAGADFKPFPEGTRFVAGVQTGPQQKVKRPAPGAEGNVLDPYSVDALNKYLSVFDKAFTGMEKDMPRSQFHDSFEYYDATFTPNLFDEFQKRRGYDLRTQLPALTNTGPADVVSRVKCDYRETLSDLHLEYMNRWVAWSHSHGGIGRNQAHGGPGNILDVYANADIPECEIFHVYEEGHLPMLKLASSAAHVTGKKLVSSESFTWLDEHFNSSLAQVKPAADFLMLLGVNHMFLHGIPYSPEDAAWPGWNFYASVNFGPSGGLWHDFPAFTAYVARCQSILQANKPSSDVLLYMPWHQFWSDPANNDKMMLQFTTPGTWMKPYACYAAATDLYKSGISYDEISDRLLEKATVENGSVKIGGILYHTVLIPDTTVIPLTTMQRLFALARDGAVVHFLGDLPSDVPGFGDLENRRAELKKLTSSLKLLGSDFEYSVADVGKGRIFVKNSEIMRFPTVDRREQMVASGLRFIRRERPDGFDYFIVNSSPAAIDQWVPVSSAAQSAILMDPRSDSRCGIAKIQQLMPNPNNVKVCSIYIQLAPGESTILRTFTDRVTQGPAWTYTKPVGNPFPLAGTWSVTFIDGGPVLPKPFTTDKLASWTLQPDPEAQRFAGTAKYTLEFSSPPPTRGSPSGGYRLDLGKIGDSARVTLNGKSLGTLWAAPFTLDLGDALKGGSNKLEIEVTNVAANRIADMDRRGVQWKIFRDANILSTAYTKFDASNWPLRDSGLLGPVQLIPLTKLEP